jgi:hypothetical protein
VARRRRWSAAPPVAFTASVSAESGSTAPTAGSDDFYDATTSADLGLGTLGSSTGTTSTWTLTTGVKTFHVTTGDSITAAYTPGTGFASSSGTTTRTVTAMPALADATASVVASPVAPVSTGAAVKAAGGVSLHSGASADAARVWQHAADGLFTAVGGAVDAAELAILGSGAEHAEAQALTAQMSVAGSPQASLDSLLWENEDSSWLDGKREWLS